MPRSAGGAPPRRGVMPMRQPSRSLDRSAIRPLWAQLHDDLMERLEAGEFTEAFPGELVLAAEYAVSRHTVREALRRLRADGLVTAERGRVPRLAAAERDRTTDWGRCTACSPRSRRPGMVQRSVTRRLEIRADGVFASRLGLEESTPLLYLERLRLAGEQPLAADRVWLPADARRAVVAGRLHAYRALRRAGRPLRAAVARRAGADQRRRADAGRTRPARRVVSGTAAFAIERLGCADGRPVEWRHTLVRGDRFQRRPPISPRESGYRLNLAATSPAEPAV